MSKVPTQNMRHMLDSVPERLKKRCRVYDAIDSERDYQNAKWPAELTVGEYLLAAEEYLAHARHLWSTEPKPESSTLEDVRKIAAILVRCMEEHGAPLRKAES